MRFDWKYKTVQEFIKDRVDKEAYIEESDYDRPLWTEPKQPKKRVRIPALMYELIRSNLP